MADDNPILLDAAVGSKSLEKPLREAGLPVVVQHLKFGDLSWTGRGVQGVPVSIGVEFKKINELITSLMDGRFQGHQLTGMIHTYDKRYLLIQGDFHHDALGRATRWGRHGKDTPIPGSPTAVELEKRLINLRENGGLHMRNVENTRDVVRVIESWYRYWTDKDQDEHKSHLALYEADMDKGLLTPPTPFRRAIKILLPGIGFAGSKIIEDYVNGSWETLRSITEDEWAEFQMPDKNGKLKRLGRSRARSITEALR